MRNAFWIFVAIQISITFEQTLNVGLLTASEKAVESVRNAVGLSRTGAAVMVAWERIQNEQILPQYTDINLTWKFDECIESLSAGHAIEFIQSKVDVILGPPCSDAAIVVGTISNFYDMPMVIWGPPFASELNDRDAYSSVAAVSYSGFPQAMATLRTLLQFEWYDVAILYEYDDKNPIQRCYLVIGDLETNINNNALTSVVHKKLVLNSSIESLSAELKSIREISRIIITCMESKVSLRNLLIAASQSDMTSAEYAYLVIDNWRYGFGTIWKSDTNDGYDSAAMTTVRRTFMLDHQPINDTNEFEKEVLAKFKEAPFFCDTCTTVDTSNSYVADLGDAMLSFAYALNKTLAARGPSYTNISGNDIAMYAQGAFSGYTSNVKINKNGTRDPVFVLYVMDPKDQQIPVIQIEDMFNSTSGTMTILQPDSVIWASRGGVKTKNVPKCGYKGTSCPKTFFELYLLYVLIGSAALILFVLITVLATLYIIRQKTLEEAKMNMLWQVPFHLLTKPTAKSTGASQRSLQSSHTLSTQHSLGSKKDTGLHFFFLLDGEAVVARKHEIRTTLSRKENADLRMLRGLDHDNVNKFIGLSLDSPQLLSVWRFCSRGSLKDIIEKGTLTMDWFFKYSLMRDIAEGIHFLHRSVGTHGWLTSSTCLVDERWQVKITFYGLEFAKEHEKRLPDGLLFTAPEIIRENNPLGTREGDVYSYAVICSQIVTKKSAWDLENQDYDTDELLYRIKRGGSNPIRPSLETDDHDVNGSVLLLIRDCWAEHPNNRPSTDQIRTLIKSMNSARSTNLMDHVFNVLETYASNLEEEVELRMKELVEEKKKSDILLYRMLPKQVAERLKTGQPIEPETFDNVTIFFSDVVSFTTLASRCTPLQVVNLLNDLYTAFDAIIDNHDVYKVETIGDGYLCVSGLPHRNGNEHAREVAEMSFELLRAIRSFRVPHLPTERIQIRIGLHTGGCVAGVVGLTMPRYCLFGDSVNTASRMESNGKPGRIHISTETNHFLNNIIGGYKTEARGEVIIKGKGAVETFWLLGDENHLDATLD